MTTNGKSVSALFFEDVEEPQVLQLSESGFQNGPSASMLIPRNPPPGDCARCGFEKLGGCVSGSIQVSSSGWRECPHAAVRGLREKTPPR